MPGIEKIGDQPNKELSPRLKRDLVTIGDILFKNGDSEQAVEYFKRAGLTEKDIEAIKQSNLTEQQERTKEKAGIQRENDEMIGKIYREMAAKAREEGDEDKAKIYELAIKHIGKKK
jgi:hypothetical protein